MTLSLHTVQRYSMELNLLLPCSGLSALYTCHYTWPCPPARHHFTAVHKACPNMVIVGSILNEEALPPSPLFISTSRYLCYLFISAVSWNLIKLNVFLKIAHNYCTVCMLNGSHFVLFCRLGKNSDCPPSSRHKNKQKRLLMHTAQQQRGIIVTEQSCIRHVIMMGRNPCKWAPGARVLIRVCGAIL